MRARRTSWTVAGTAGGAASGGRSAIARTSSSRKNGLPSARARIVSASGSETVSTGTTERTRARLSRGASGWSAIWVA